MTARAAGLAGECFVYTRAGACGRLAAFQSSAGARERVAVVVGGLTDGPLGQDWAAPLAAALAAAPAG